ncbi:Beta-barrel assembly-enhancing protease [Ferriphaselus amnicola]|uniref:Beta-barrel assembly-enhancing protease n=2 Tax=Ferriphaselus amnicola TaxID=1188319 RepID=A0A2Z6G9K6_9PROT|nr:Beta-barrel assembly-enhancing protease [Ferriphaselus amnicola]
MRHLAKLLSIGICALAMTPTPIAASERASIHIERRPSSLVLHTRLSSAWQTWHQGDLASAQRQYLDVLHTEPRNRDALLGLAAIALQQNDDRLASNYFGRTLALDPRDPIAHSGLTLIGNDESAESPLKLLLEQHPDSAALYFALGKLYGEQSRWSEARDAFKHAHRLAPDEAAPLLDLAICLDHLNQPRAATENYLRALQLDKSGNTFNHGAITLRLQQLNPERHDSH